MLGEQCLQVVLSTDEQDFTDFCYALDGIDHRFTRICTDLYFSNDLK